MADVGTRLVFEKDDATERGTLEVARASGRVDRIALEAGQVSSRAAGDTPGARDVGATRCHEILVELKR